MDRELCVRIFRALFEMKTNEMSTGRRIDILCHIHKMEQYTVVVIELSITHWHDVKEIIEKCIY